MRAIAASMWKRSARDMPARDRTRRDRKRIAARKIFRRRNCFRSALRACVEGFTRWTRCVVHGREAVTNA